MAANGDVDGYSNQNGGGFKVPLTQDDTVKFVKRQADYAHQLGLAMGLKNAEQVIDRVSDYIEFAVNEQCVELNDCATYVPFLSSGKPVFHIEYPKNFAQDASKDCLQGNSNAPKYSTVLKNLSLDAYVYYCDGSEYKTSTSGEKAS
jgi:hypothetical protein